MRSFLSKNFNSENSNKRESEQQNNSRTMPNFLIIGAGKAGTSSIYYYLQQHPQVYMSPLKEPKFFALEGEPLNFQGPDRDIVNRNSVNNLEAYQNLFRAVSTEIAIGEASPLYLYSPKAPARIKHYLPEAKLIAILRNPVERAFSSFTHLLREGYENLSFEQALVVEENRIQKKWAPLWHYTQKGYYYEQLKRYFDIFDRGQIQVYLYEDLQANSTNVIQNIYNFVGVDNTFIPDLSRKNVSGTPKSRIVHDLFTKDNLIKSLLKPFFPKQLRRNIADITIRQNLGSKPMLSYETRHKLLQLYREDILQLQDLIQRDLSAWLA